MWFGIKRVQSKRIGTHSWGVANHNSQLNRLFVRLLLYSIGAFCLVISSNAWAERAYPGMLVKLREHSGLSISQAENRRANVSRVLKARRLKIREQVGKTLFVASEVESLAQENSVSEIDKEKVKEICQEIASAEELSYCEPNYELKALATPNDTNFNSLWGLQSSNGMDIDASAAWDLHTGSDNVVVAILDTGVDYSHPDLSGNIWSNPSESLNGIDDDGNGYIDDIHGINAINSSGNPMDDNGHGSHVAGTIGASGNNNKGVVGVNWRTQMIGVKFLGANGSGSLLNAIKGLKYLVKLRSKGVNIVAINNSWGGGGYSQALYDAIDETNQAGIVFVAAAGNESADNDSLPHYPSDYDLPNILSVAAIDKNGNLASFSNYGATSVDIAAPGVNILSTTPGNHYNSYSGTSMATPHVSGAITLLSSYNPSLTMLELRNRVIESGKGLSSLTGVVSSGRLLNVARMLAGITAPVPIPQQPIDFEYSVEEITYTPQSGMENEPMTLQADELNYKEISLPFGLPFYTGVYSTITLSPNGVIYIGNSPSGMDYQVGTKAPKKAIAAFWADLIANQNPYGIRVRKSDGMVIVYWQAKHYNYQDVGTVEIQAELHSDGVIEIFVKFSNAELASALGGKSLIGMSGASSNHLDNFQGELNLETAVRFTPLGEQPFSDTWSIKKSKKLKVGKNILKVNGELNADALLSLALGQTRCDIKNFKVIGYPTSVQFKMPNLRRVRGELKAQVIKAGQLKAETKLKFRPKISSSGNHGSTKSFKKFSQSKLNKLCKRIQSKNF